MAVKDDILWFKQQFAQDVIPALSGTPISFDLVCALAFQESGELWSQLRKRESRDEVLRLCVGDTLDAPNRGAFPKTKAELVAATEGQRMFELAHELLQQMGDATQIEIYEHLATKPDKFVHGYGIFQYDLQHFKIEPRFFLDQQWKDIEACVQKLMEELKGALASLRLGSKKSLTDLQSCFVAIVYNTGFGNFDQDRGIKQGFNDGKCFYGEYIDRYLQVAHAIPTPSTPSDVISPPPSTTTPPTTVVPPSPAGAASIMAIASAEFEKYHGIDEGHEPLRSRIADYYEAGNGSRTLDPTLDENAWSAAFVSFCVRKSGATSAQFKFNLSHSVYVQAAIENEDNNRGVFRGHPITSYAPKLGDIIHHNRSGGTLTFEFARAHAGYPSHAAVVVDLVIRNGVKTAVTIGGNEGLAHGSGTVGQKFFPLDASGLLDQAHIGPKLICLIENQLAAGVAAKVQPMQLGHYLVNVRTDLKLRGGPGTEFLVIKALVNETPVDVLEFDDNASGRWALVDLEGDGIKDGYVFAKFLEPVSSTS
jgi:hypothetical protein